MIWSPGDPTTTSSPCSLVPRWRPPTHPHGKPRQKRHHNKSRDGCSTCRRRRVKCDEQRPSCNGCLRLGLKCGYATSSSTSSLQLCQNPSSLLSRTSFDLLDLSFFVKNSVELLSFSPDRFPDSHIPLTSNEFPESCHIRFTRFWNSVVLPAACMEPGILELVSLFARRHRLALTTSYNGTTDNLRMFSIMAKIIHNHSPDMVIIGAMIFFAFERLESAATGIEPADQDNVHCKAVVAILPTTSQTIASYILPILNVTWKLSECHKGRSNEELVEIPERIESSIQARQCFTDILRSSDIRQSLEKCLVAIRRYFNEVRGRDWEESRAVLTILAEARYLGTALNIDLDEPTGRGLYVGENRALSVTEGSNSS